MAGSQRGRRDRRDNKDLEAESAVASHGTGPEDAADLQGADVSGDNDPAQESARSAKPDGPPRSGVSPEGGVLQHNDTGDAEEPPVRRVPGINGYDPSQWPDARP
jgi:hypothetical protein